MTERDRVLDAANAIRATVAPELYSNISEKTVAGEKIITVISAVVYKKSE